MGLGGLGITDLKLATIAMRTGLLWLQRNDFERTWAQLQIKAHPMVYIFQSFNIHNGWQWQGNLVLDRQLGSR
jgi:hypothetical protein